MIGRGEIDLDDNLFGAVPAANQAGHLRHVGGAEVRPATAAPPAGGGIAVSLLGAVLGLVRGDIAAQLPSDGAGLALQLPGDLAARYIHTSVAP